MNGLGLMSIKWGMKNPNVIDFSNPAAARNVWVASNEGGARGVLVEGRCSTGSYEHPIDIKSDGIVFVGDAEDMMPFSVIKVVGVRWTRKSGHCGAKLSDGYWVREIGI